jgi:small subunit ribosomal protein S20
VPHNKSTKKRVKTNEIRRQRNVQRRKKMRRAIRDLRVAIAAGKSDPKQLGEVTQMLDRMAGKGLIPQNRAARLKSRLSEQASAQS